MFQIGFLMFELVWDLLGLWNPTSAWILVLMFFSFPPALVRLFCDVLGCWQSA